MHTNKGLVGWPFTSEGAHATHEAFKANVDAHLPARPAAVLQRPLPLRAPVARVARDMGDEPRGADFKLYDACAEGRLELVKKWWPLSKHPLHTFKFIVTPSWDEHGQHSFPYFQNVLHAACEGGHLDVVEYLLELHFWAFKQDSLGRTPLKIACEHGQAACAARCLDHTPEVKDEPDGNGQTPFHAACVAGSTAIADSLYRKGANLSRPALIWHRNDDGTWCKLSVTPLAAAVRSGSKPLVECLLNWGVDSETPVTCESCADGECSGDVSGLTPFQLAVLEEHDFASLLKTKVRRRWYVSALRLRARSRIV